MRQQKTARSEMKRTKIDGASQFRETFANAFPLNLMLSDILSIYEVYFLVESENERVKFKTL